MLSGSGEKLEEKLLRPRSEAGRQVLFHSCQLVQIKERLFPASFRKQHLAAQEAGHAAATAGRATQRGGAPSNRESTEHALVHQPIQEAGDCQCTGGSSNSPVAASDGSICL